MFDLAINTTLESKTLAAYTLAFLRRLPCPGNWGCAIFLVFGKIEYPNKSFQEEIKVVIFLRLLLCALSSGFGIRRSSFSYLDGSIKESRRSNCS
ncbi:hypothetical protein GQ457_12G015260 [Hibiscus cannabinus]